MKPNEDMRSSENPFIPFDSSPAPPAAAPRAIVAIPVRNERERIVACLDALAGQVGLRDGDFGIVLFLNNCTDGTAAVVRSFNMPWPVRVFERHDPGASAGWARRIAMEAASTWLAEAPEPDGVLMTSDADSRVAADWVMRNLAAIAKGADLVAGRITLEPSEAALLPERLRERGRLETKYEAQLMEIEARLDPQPGDAWPCHWSKSGATLAVRRAAYLKVGGMPDMTTGEDRAFVDAIRRHDFVVRHDCDIVVVTSGRLDGRAHGGVADTIKLRCDEPDSPCDDRLEPVHRLIGRILWRRRLRRLYDHGRLLATWRWAPALSIAAPVARAIAQSRRFGAMHAAIEASSARLAYRPVRPTQLPRQIRHAAVALWALRLVDRWRAVPRPSLDNAGTLLRIADHPPARPQGADAL